jgi:hypothetical protein
LLEFLWLTSKACTLAFKCGQFPEGSKMNAATATPEQTAMVKALMSEYDIHLLIDSSGSMNYPHITGQHQTRWQVANELCATISAAAKEIDGDGINIVTFGADTITYNNVTPDTLPSIFTKLPTGSTPLHLGLDAIFKVAGGTSKKDMIVCLTDGCPDNPQAAAASIVAQANSQTADDDCTVLFIQVGNDASATSYLKMLDDNLKGSKFDIVDAVTAEDVYKAPSIAHLLQAAITG